MVSWNAPARNSLALFQAGESMTNHNIEQSQWRSYLDDFSARHIGQPVTIEVLADEEGHQILADDLPLVGLVDDPKNSEGRIIEIIVGETAETRIVHEVHHPSHIRVARTDGGEDAALEFESTDEPKILLHFGQPQTAAHLVG
jgi:hypothetical protein